jgi:hypothetical protein
MVFKVSAIALKINTTLPKFTHVCNVTFVRFLIAFDWKCAGKSGDVAGNGSVFIRQQAAEQAGNHPAKAVPLAV